MFEDKVSSKESKSSKDELFDADPNCKHDTKPQPGGGIACVKCGGWFCF